MNSRMRVITILISLVLTPLSILASNLFVIPNGTTENTVQVFTSNPVSNAGTYESGPGLVEEIAATPDGSRYFTAARTSMDALVQTGASFTVLARSDEWNDSATDLTVTPDGKYALVTAGILRIFDAVTGAEVATAPVGANPVSVAVSIDSKYALVLSSISQRLYRVDLTTFTVTGNLEITGQSTAVAAGPNGRFYVGATNKVVVVDGETMEEIVPRIQVNGTPEKLYFTPDGTFGIAANRLEGNAVGTTLWAFDLASNAVHSSIGPLGDNVRRIRFDPRLAVVSNDRAFAASPVSNVIYDIQLPDLDNLAVLSPGGTPSPTNVSGIVMTGEMPQARYLFYANGQSLYRVDLNNDALSGSPQSALYVPTALRMAGPSSTAVPTSTILYNNNQVIAAEDGQFRPLVVRALDVAGLPVYNATVEISSVAGVTITNAMSRTNKDGLAMFEVDPGDVVGPIPVDVTIGDSLLATFDLAVGSSGGGGGALGGISIVSGQGQLIGDPNSYLIDRALLVVGLTDTDGQPVNGANINWAVSSGSGYLIGASFGSALTTQTDQNGQTSVLFSGPIVVPALSMEQSVITASWGDNSVDFYVTTVPTKSLDNYPLGTPSTVILKPTFDNRVLTGRIGETLEGAFVLSVFAESGPQSGDPIPNVALNVSTGKDPANGPSVQCLGPGGAALTGPDGIATCDLQIGGQVGMADLRVQVGGNFVRLPGYSIVTLPGVPATVEIASGDLQSGDAGEALSSPLVAVVRDGAGNSLSNVNVTWTVLQAGQVVLSNIQSTSDQNGRVQANATLGTTPGTYDVRVTAGAASATFKLTVNVAISGLARVSGNDQIAIVGQAFAQPLVVKLSDEDGAGVAGQQINFTVTSGSAVLASAASTTNAQGNAQMQVTAGNSPGPVTISAAYSGFAAVNFNLTVRLPGPIIDATSFINGASGAAGLVPGSVSVATGPGIAPNVQNCAVAQTFGALPTELAGVTVEFGSGVFAPIFHVCNVGGVQSVAFQTPFELAAPGQVSVTIRVQGGASTADNVPVVPIQPGIFEATGQGGLPYAVVLRPNGSTVSPQNPAQRGETLALFATGLGPVTPPSGTNFLGVPGQNVVANLIIGINNQGVRVLTAEYAINSIGLYIVRFEVPQDAPSGSALPLALAVRTSDGGLLFGNGSSLAVQ